MRDAPRRYPSLADFCKGVFVMSEAKENAENKVSDSQWEQMYHDLVDKLTATERKHREELENWKRTYDARIKSEGKLTVDAEQQINELKSQLAMYRAKIDAIVLILR